MGNTTETVFVEFVVDDTQMESAQDTLQRTGQIDKQAAAQFKATNAELARRQQTIDNLNKQLKSTQDQNAKTIADMETRLENFIKEFIEGFSEGIVDTLKEAGFEFDEFGKIINKNNDSTKKSSTSLRSELKAMTLQLAEMKRRGEDNTEEYFALARAAGELKDTIGDAAQQVNNFASDTSKLDGAIQAVQGLAGAFAVAQGAIGVFTDDNEQLQQVMLKVNSALAILQGLQTVGNALQKESAAATFLQTVAQKAYNVVVGESVGLMAALRVAFAATGIGAVVLSLTALVFWLKSTSTATKQLVKDITAFNDTLEAQTNDLNKSLQNNARIQEEIAAEAKARGAKQSELNKAEIADLLSTRDAIRATEEENRSRYDTAVATINAIRTGEQEFNEDLLEQSEKFVSDYQKLQQQRLDIASQVRIKSIENERQIQLEALQAVADNVAGRLALARKNSAEELQLAKESARANAAIELQEAGDNIEKRLLIERQLQAKIRDLNREFAIVRQQDAVTQAELAFEKVQQASKDISERGSQEEIDAQKKVIQERARLDLLAVGLTETQKTAIRTRALEQQLQLQKDFNKQSAEDAINDQIALNSAILSNIHTSNQERLHLNEENIILTAQLEIDAAKGQADKIAAIRAKMNDDIRAARLADLQKTLDYELALQEAQTGALRRASERIAQDQRKSLSQRIAAINQVASLDIQRINEQEDALEDSLKRGLISQEEYNLKLAQLKDKELEVVENAELKKRELQKQTFQQQFQFAVDTASQVLQLISDFGQQQTDAEQARIEEQRAAVDALRESGAITEKEAEARQKRLDAQENALKRKQAQRDKAIALFQAIINAAAATVKALLEGGPIYAAIVAALGAAQVALIASKPIPKFGKGKRPGEYEGPAEIGETGPELWQHNGQTYLAKKSSVVWVGKNDRVYTPKETSAIMQNMQPYIVKDADTKQYHTVNNGMAIDYDKLGTTIAKNIPQVGLNIDEKGMYLWVEKGNSFTKYLDSRRGYK